MGASALFYLAEKGLTRDAHVEHSGAVQQRPSQFLAGTFPHLARALRQRNIAGALGIGKPINAGAARMAAAAMRGSELIEPGNAKTPPGQFDGSETAHGP